MDQPLQSGLGEDWLAVSGSHRAWLLLLLLLLLFSLLLLLLFLLSFWLFLLLLLALLLLCQLFIIRLFGNWFANFIYVHMFERTRTLLVDPIDANLKCTCGQGNEESLSGAEHCEDYE